MTTLDVEALTAAASRLHRSLRSAHWDGSTLSGPDPGIRFNARIYRFAKSYTRFVPWRDDRTYAQAQK
ncbi:MAG: hypothetical protein R3282_01750, partial [Rhodothermales bacterium]|nr:hypothetical protein [Rhodothermales bacterium]